MHAPALLNKIPAAMVNALIWCEVVEPLYATAELDFVSTLISGGETNRVAAIDA